VNVSNDGTPKHSADSAGKHRLVTFDAAQKDRVLKAYTEIISAKPVPRAPRFRQAVAEEKKPELPKPPAP
jgi:hypothetical protein